MGSHQVVTGTWLLLWPRAFYDNVLVVSVTHLSFHATHSKDLTAGNAIGRPAALGLLHVLPTALLILGRRLPHVSAPGDVYPM